MGGKLQTDYPTSYNVTEIKFLNFKPTKQCYTFLGWQFRGNYIESTEGLAENIDLEAIWSEYGTLNNSDIEVAVNDRTVKLKMPNSQFNTHCHIIVGSNVREIQIESNVNMTYNMYIDFEARTADISLSITNFSIKAPFGYNAITMESEYKLDLNTYGICSISGGTGDSAAIDRTGGIGIKCHTLVIHTSDLSIYGGDGGKGQDGNEGTVGGRGANGGNGNYAVYATGIVEILANNVTLCGGNGGLGGNGGTGKPYGGKGGNGGNGKSAVYTLGGIVISADNITLQGGNGGNGGHGGGGITIETSKGKGGAGGLLGMGSVALNGDIDYGNHTNINIVAGINGKSGSEGYVMDYMM